MPTCAAKRFLTRLSCQTALSLCAVLMAMAPSPADALPDLTVTSVTGPANAGAGTQVTVSDTVAAADGNAGPFYVSYYLSSDATISTSDTFLGRRYLLSGLSSGMSNSASTTVTIPQNLSGTYYLGAIADGDPYGCCNNLVPESDETNNGLAGSQISISADTEPPSPKDYTQISAGRSHVLAIKSDGSLWGWGDNASGQIGDGTVSTRNFPVSIATGSSWNTVSAGGTHSLAVRSDGTLWAWGYNGFGQLGTGTNTATKVPVQVGSDNHWLMVSAGNNQSFALKSDGTLWAWGHNKYGQLGDGSTTDRNAPGQVGQESNWASVFSLGGFVVARKSDGTLWAWGDNSYGQLGIGSTEEKHVPWQVGTDNTWAAASAGFYHVVAVTTDGTLWAWGQNVYGQLGNGNTTNQSTPVQIGSDEDWAAVTAGQYHTLALKQNGTMWAWGSNSHGEAGGGASTKVLAPLQVGTETQWNGLSAGWNMSLALRTDGTLWTWGYTSYGALDRLAPHQVGTGDTWMAVAGGAHHSASIKSNGKLWTWGNNLYGQLGDDTNLQQPAPVQMGTENWLQASAGENHTIARMADGTLWTWGYNLNGQLGNGTTVPRSSPDQVGNDTDWIHLSAGRSHSAGIRSDGSLWVWGWNAHGQVGNGGTVNQTSPVQVGAGYTWSTVAAGGQHTVAIRSDGTLWAWGNNAYGQLGDNSVVKKTAPVKIGTDTNWAAVAAGQWHTMALKTDGTLYAWGDNSWGQLGDGTTTKRLVPTWIATSYVWSKVVAGANHTVGIMTDGTLWAWGRNENGQIGDGTRISPASPVQVRPDLTWTHIGAGDLHTLAVASDGTLRAWGYNGFGQLGDGAEEPKLAPEKTISEAILINNGAATTVERQVTLNLHVSDVSGVAEMQFSNDNSTWSAPESFVTTTGWTLTEGDGPKTVWARFSDSLGNWSQGYSGTITLDAPDLTVTAVSAPASAGAGTTVTVNDTVTVTNGDADLFYVSYYLSADNVITTSDAYLGSREVPGLVSGETSSESQAVTIPQNLDGIYYIGAIADDFPPSAALSNRIQESCETNNASAGVPITVTAADLTMISLSAPVSAGAGTTVTVNDTVAVTNGNAGQFSISYYLSADSVIMISDVYLGYREVPGLVAGETSSGSQIVTIPQNLNGIYYIGAIADEDPNVSMNNLVLESDEENNAIAGNRIYIGTDTVPPTGSLLINDGAATADSAFVTLTLSATDSESGVSQMQFSEDTVTWSTPESYGVTKTWTLSEGDGVKTVWGRFSDIVGNWSEAYPDTIVLNTLPPPQENMLPKAQDRYLVWQDDEYGNNEIMFKKSEDGGATWSVPTRLTENASNSQSPRLAVDGRNLYVIWQDDYYGNDELFLLRSADGGTTWSGWQRLTENTSISQNARIAVGGQNVYVVWQDDSYVNDELFMLKSTDGGVTWSASTRLTNSTSDSRNPSIAIEGQNMHVVWEAGSSTNGELYFMQSSDGGATWSAPAQLADNTSNSRNPRLAVDGQHLYVVWEDDAYGNNEIMFRKSEDGGSTWSFPTRLTDNASNSRNPRLAADFNMVYVVWQDDYYGNDELFLLKSSDRGASWWSMARLTENAGNSRNPTLLVYGQKISVAWQDNTSGLYAIYTAESADGGTMWSSATQITSSTGNSQIPFMARPEIPITPRIRSRSDDGAIVISWDGIAETNSSRFRIYRRTATTAYAPVADIVANWNYSYTDTNVVEGTTYYYRIVALDGAGNESAWYIETAETYTSLPMQTFALPGVTVAAVGDINGDGNPDLVVGDPNYTVGKGGNAKSHAGKVEIYFGGNTSGDPDVTLLGENENDQFGYALALVNMNNDSYDDLIVGTPYYSRTSPIWTPSAGKVSVYAGGTSFSTIPVYTRIGDESVSENLGFSVGAAGDVNNDGNPDVAIGAPQGGVKISGYRTGRILILFGGNLSSPGSTTAIGYGLYHMGCTVAAAGDVNGDGYGDILSGNVLGPITGSYVPSFLYGGSYSLGFGFSVPGTGYSPPRSAGDINCDGYADFAIGRNIFFGGPSVDPVVDRFLSEAPDFLSALGDVNGDGSDDMLFGPGPRVYFSGTPADDVPDLQYEGLNIIAAGDVDRDGKLEALAGADATSVYLYSIASFVTATHPDITILSPKNNLKTDASDVLVSGIVQGTVTNFQVGGKDVDIQPDGTFMAMAHLFYGKNVIEIHAETQDGRIVKRLLTVNQAEPTPLTVSITSPAAGTVYSSEGPITVYGTISDASATVVVNGTLANLGGGTFAAANIDLMEGPNTITAVAQDDFGQTAESTITVMLLTKGMLTGTATDAVTMLPLPDVSVSVQDSQGTHTTMTDSQGAYTVSGIAAGSYTAAFTKTGYGTQTSNGTVSNGQVQTINVPMTPLPPLTVDITSPLNGETLNASPVVVAGMMSNDAAVTVNGIAATAGSGAFMASIPLNEGPNEITAVASDSYNQTASDAVAVTLVTKGTVTGRVTDSEGTGVASAKVTVTDSLSIVQTVYAGANGDYTIPGVTQGQFTITMTQVDYSTFSDSGSMTAGGTAMVNGTISLQAPAISSVTPADVSGCSATVTWATDQPTSSVFEYGTTASYGTVITDPTFTTSHSVNVNGLAAGTVYHYNVTSTNGHGLSSASGDGMFTTVSLPAISSVIVSNITISSATVTWTTDQASDSVVTYGTTTAYGSNASDAALTTSHGIQLDNLGMQTEYHFTVSSTNDCGHTSTSDDAAFTTEGPITVTITSPTASTTIARPDIMVKGTFTNITGNETGVVVNGVVATVYGDAFVANHVPLTEGAGDITVTATDAGGYTASAAINVAADTAGNYISLITNIESGTSVLSPTLRIDGYDDSTTPDISYTGPGAPDWTECTSYEACKVQLTTEGVYYFTATGTGYDGNTYSDTIAITVLSKAEIDALLQAKWEGMKTALAGGDIDEGVSYFSLQSRERYRQIFSYITIPLSDFVQNMQSIQLIYATENTVKYRIRKNELYNGLEQTLTYYIYFTKNNHGLWEIWKF